MQYKSEEDFLNHYNPDEYEKLSITADILVTSISLEKSDNYRKLNNRKFSILLVKRNSYPFKDKWCLPGGFLGMKETLEDAAKRILETETNLKDIYLEQLYTFSEIERDPRMRIISTAYLSLIDKNKLDNKLNIQADWFNIDVIENDKEIKVSLLNENNENITFTAKKKYSHFTSNKCDYEIMENEKIAFDHCLVILYGLDRLKNKIEYTDIAFNLMPEYFTLGELQQVYEIILNKKLIIPDFRRKIKDKVEKTDKVQRIGGHRPSVLYRYKNQKNTVI